MFRQSYVFNKKDLAKQEELELLYETYKSCGYDVSFFQHLLMERGWMKYVRS